MSVRTPRRRHSSSKTDPRQGRLPFTGDGLKAIPVLKKTPKGGNSLSPIIRRAETLNAGTGEPNTPSPETRKFLRRLQRSVDRRMTKLENKSTVQIEVGNNDFRARRKSSVGHEKDLLKTPTKKRATANDTSPYFHNWKESKEAYDSSLPLKMLSTPKHVPQPSVIKSKRKDCDGSSVAKSPLTKPPIKDVGQQRKRGPSSSSGDSDDDSDLSLGDDDDFGTYSNSDDDIPISCSEEELKRRAQVKMAEIIKEVTSKSALSTGTTPRHGTVEPEDDVMINYNMAKQKEATWRQHQKTLRRAKQEEAIKLEKEKRIRESVDAPIEECEAAGIRLFSYEIGEVGFAPSHKLLKLMNDNFLLPSQVGQAQPFDFDSSDIEWLLVRLLRETITVEREVLIGWLAMSKQTISMNQLIKVLKAIGLRYWDKKKGSQENKVSAYSVLNMNRRTDSEMFTPIKARRSSLASSFEDSPKMGSFDSPFVSMNTALLEQAETIQPPPPLRHWCPDSLSDFLDVIALLIEPNCVEFLFSLLVLISADSSLDFLQTPGSIPYAAMSRLLDRVNLPVDLAIQLAYDCLDLKSAQVRFLQAVSSGMCAKMIELYQVCGALFFLREYFPGKTINQLALAVATDENVITSVFMENLNDFSAKSTKSSSHVRYMFTLFIQCIDMDSVKSWKSEDVAKIEQALQSRVENVQNLNDFKFNSIALSWISRVSNERVAIGSGLI